MCKHNLPITHCPYHSGCSKCLETNVEYPIIQGCKSARIICRNVNETKYVRLNHIGGGEPLEIKESMLGMLNCSSTGWRYTHRRIEYMVTGVTCFITPESKQQSPVDIERNEVSYDPNLDPAAIDFNYAVGDAYSMEIFSGREGFQIYMEPDPFDVYSTFTASHLDGVYQPYNLHAHWSDPQNRSHMGSEHLLFGMKKTAEIHIVNWDPKYGTYQAAIGKPDGIAVISILVETGAPNPEFGKITNIIAKNLPISHPIEVDKDELDNIDIGQLFPQNKDYLTYTGSLTTPSYAPCVIWTLFINPITISEEQLGILLKLYNQGNDRHPQDVSSVITSSFLP